MNNIEQNNYDPLFRKMTPCIQWCDVSNVAWSVIHTENLAAAERDCHAISRSWLNAQVRKWGKECDNESKRRNTKDENGVLLPALLPSKSPLKEFAEASFRAKSSNFNPCSPLKDNVEPGTHLVMAVLGVLIGEINECAAGMSDANTLKCFDQIQVCRTYSRVKDDWDSVLSALPIKLIELEADKTKKSTTEDESNKENYDTITATVSDMDTIEKLLTQVVKLVSAAKTNPSSTSSSSALTWTALGEFQWEKLKTGTLGFSSPLLHIQHRYKVCQCVPILV